MKEPIEIRFLGTGTSTGVPQIGCECDVCQSSDPRDQRLRTSALVSVGDVQLLIDCGPDFRMQMLPLPFRQIDGVLITHGHFDHIGGLEDLRPFSRFGDVPIFAEKNVCRMLKKRLSYVFEDNPYPGIPKLDLREISLSPFLVQGIEIQPIRVMHHKLPILGFRIGGLAYITDMKTMPEEELSKLGDIDVLIVNALRKYPHLSHQMLSDALAFAEKVRPTQTYLVHMCHEIGLHSEVERQLPKNVQLAYDGLTIRVG